MNKFLILGNGYVGNYILNRLGKERATMITGKVFDMNVLKRVLLEMYPSHTLINCAGKTGRPNIDWCEDNKDVVFGANVGLPVMIAEAMRDIKQYWVHVGSGCIFNGYEQEWTEEDVPNHSGSFYSKTKMLSQDILSEYDEPLILRIRMPVDEELKERSYVHKVVEYAKKDFPLFNLQNSMTFLDDFCDALIHLTERGCTGTYNVVNEGGLTIKDTLELYRKHVDPKLRFRCEDESVVQATMKAKRSNCILSTDKLKAEGFVMPKAWNRMEQVLKLYGRKHASD